MPNMLYTHPWMLTGLAALAVPVIIHLLLRRKKKRLRFSTLQFFVKQDQQSSQRRKLRNWVLLAMRLLLVALLVTAFARPFLPRGGASALARQRRQAIFVLDRSASMWAVGTDGQRWRRATELMQKVLGALAAEDRAAVVGCSSQTEVLSGFAPPASLAQILTALQPEYGTCNLGEGLQQAAKLASNGDPEAATTIYVVSDLQRSACRNLGNYPIPSELNVELLCAGDVSSPNLTVSDLQPESRDGHKPCLAVASFSDEDTEVTAELEIDQRPAFSCQLRLQAGASTNMDLAIPVLKPGWHDAIAALKTQDSFALDNTRYAVFFVPEPLHALVVESRKTARVFEQDSFFLTTALDPAQGSTNAVPSGFTFAQVAPEDLAARLSGSSGREGCDLVVVPGLKEISPQVANSLNQFVTGGGGLLLFLGEGVSANRYNNELQELLPAQLGNLELAPDITVGWRVGQFDTNAAAFAVFNLPESGDLGIPQFFKRCALKLAEGAAPLAFFEDGAPLLLTRALGRGYVALIDTSADTSWSDWPKHKTFVPWLHGLGKQLARKRGQLEVPASKSLLVGDEIEIDLGPGARKAQFVLQCPNRAKLTLAADDLGRLRKPDLVGPGIYSIQTGDGRELERIAVNLPLQESDLAAFRPLEFQQQIARLDQPAKTMPGLALLGTRAGEKEFWRLLLLGALGLLVAETLVANRTSA